MCRHLIATPETSLMALYPELSSEWHPERNSDLTPDQVVPGSGKKVWWRCHKNETHEWQSSVSGRVRGRGCPVCANKVVSATNSLCQLYPHIAAEWHPTKNGSLTPDQVVPGSGKKVWWQCRKDSSHEWETAIANRAKGTDCPICAGKTVTVANSLHALYPHLAKEWHLIKNDGLTSRDVLPGSHRRVWWQCQVDPTHEWQAMIANRSLGGGICPLCVSLLTLHPTHVWQAKIVGRAKRGYGCQKCSGRVPTPTTSLQALYPQLAREWHPTKNGTLTPNDVVPGSGTKVWWRCQIDTSHEWAAVIASRVHGNGCLICSGQVATPTTCLSYLRPDLAVEWHPTKNRPLTPDDVKPGSGRKVWWQCQVEPAHIWHMTINYRAQGHRCPMCQSLQALYPRLAAEWHPTKNGTLTPDTVKARGEQKAWWQCRKNPSHEWQASISSRVRGGKCHICVSKKVTLATSLQALYPHIAAEWHPVKNGKLTPDQVLPRSNKKVWWRCQSDPSHEWESMITNRIKGEGTRCPLCSGLIATSMTSLRALYPHLAAEWHPTKNGILTPDDVIPGSEKRVWWRCQGKITHEWEARIYDRTRSSNCPGCNNRWTLSVLRSFIGSLREHLTTLTAAELYLLFQQNGLLTGKSKAFAKALATGRFPLAEIEKFLEGVPSLVDQFLDDPTQTLESLEKQEQELDVIEEEMLQSEMHDELVNEEESDGYVLPVVETRKVLAAFDHARTYSADEDAVEFLISSALTKIWRHTFRDEVTAIAQARSASGSEYMERVKERFLMEYEQAKALDIPSDYAFHMDSKLVPPNLMQRLGAVRVREQKRVGNWSGTGAGKTLSAILASRVINAQLTVICCPNSVVKGWQDAIFESFPQSLVKAKTFTPNWDEEKENELGFGRVDMDQNPRYLVLNYESFQQEGAARKIRMLTKQETVDLIIIDEIHYAKQRQVEDMSRRRKLVAAMIAFATQQNHDLHVLGMSATPVINNLQEGKSMVELVTGLTHDDLQTQPTVPNCMSLHQKLVRLGIRWMPEYRIGYEQQEIEVDCSSYLNEIQELGQQGSPLALEHILTKARLTVIRQQVLPKTLIYTQLIHGIDQLLWDALTEDRWKIGFYTGEEKSGLNGFLHGDIDILIGTSAIGTGVDGLQHVCNRLIVNVLPWTAAEFEQLKGRIFRQGQRRPVTLILPLTYAIVNGERWSWCESKMQRLHFKKSVADAAVDGVVPEGHLRTPAQAYQDLMAWLKRLDEGRTNTVTRSQIIVPLPEEDEIEVQRRHQQYGAFSAINRIWNQSQSEKTHERLQVNPEEWAHYHTLYREKRKDWAVVPYKEMINWCQERSGKVIGDFGCGEALLAQAVSDRHTVYSIDHIAINEHVIACDMSHVPLDDETLDVAIFSLSLMGANFTYYLREAHRTLKLDGQLHIIEATERFTHREQFTKDLEGLGFDVIRVEDLWKFTHIRAIKTEQRVRKQVELHF